MRTWEIREGDAYMDGRQYSKHADVKDHDSSYEEGYECGYEDGYTKAMKDAFYSRKDSYSERRMSR